MNQIPIKSIPSQAFKTVLDGQNIKLKIYQKPEGLYFDLASDGVDIVTAVLAHDMDPLVKRNYVGFRGEFLFVDLQGSSDPEYSELATRYALIYLDEEERGFLR